MLGCTNSVYVDEKWTLREWLMMTKSRQASDAKDVVFAGLSAIRSEEMLIDQSLQLRSPSSIHRKPVHGTNAIRTPKHIRLWEVLLLRFVR
jgi:asparagine synthetase A